MLGIHHVDMSDRQEIGKIAGKDVSRAKTLAQALKMGGLDWTVSKRRLHSDKNVPLPVYGIFRDDMPDDKGFLSWAGKTFQPIQNLKQFQVIEEIVGTAEGAKYENVGFKDNGQIVFAQVALPTLDFKVGGRDEHRSLLTSINGHKWGNSKQLFLTAIRIVCQNTLSAAIAIGKQLAKEGKGIRILHSQKADQRLDEAIITLQGVKLETLTMQQRLELLASRKASPKGIEDFAVKLFKPTKEDKKKSKHPLGLNKSDAEVLEAILANFEYNDDNAFPEFKHTLYSLLNATTEYVDHAALHLRRAGDLKNASSEQIRAHSAMFGDGAKMKEAVVEILLEGAKTAKHHDYAKVYTTAANAGRTNILDDVLNVTLIN